MGNEQQNGSSHHFIINKTNTENLQQERTSPSKTEAERISPTRQTQSTMSKPSWQIARDISIDILSRKTTKLNLRQDKSPTFNKQRPISRRSLWNGIQNVSKGSHSYRTPKMPTDKDTIKVYTYYDILCSSCNNLCIDEFIRCRVCNKAYHSQCLRDRGHLNNQYNFPRFGKSDWCCPGCSDFTRLLTEDELHSLMNAFEKIDRNGDGYIILQEYLTFKSDKNETSNMELFVQQNYEVGKKYFSLMDSAQTGAVAWSDFVHFYSCKLIAAKNKTELAAKLSEKELILARTLLFKDSRLSFDNDRNITITRSDFFRIYHDYFKILQNKYGIEFLDTILNYEQQINEIDANDSSMDWNEFIREISILILLNRFNGNSWKCAPRRATIPPCLEGVQVVQLDLPSIETHSSRKLAMTEFYTPTFGFLSNTSDDMFRKHAKILDKLNQRSRQEEYNKKQMGSSTSFTIVENVEDEENLKLPKLKPNGRDDRRTVTDPWTSANELQKLRNQPILIRRTPVRLLKS